MSDMNENNTTAKLWQTCRLHNAKYVMVLNIPSQMYYMNYVVASVCNTLLIITGIILNAATILAYWRSARLRNKTSYFLIMLLSALDLTTAIVGNVAFVLSLAFTLHGHPNCTVTIFHEIVTFFTVCMSLSTLFALNMDRYISIIHPFFHRTKITKTRLLGMTATFWLYGCVVTLSYPILGNFIAREIINYTTVFDIVLTMCMYIMMCRAVRRSTSNLSQANGHEVKKMHNLKMAKSCAIVVYCTAMCFVPFIVVRFRKTSTFIIMFMEVWAKTLSLLNSSLNSLLFFWRNPILRKEAKAVLKDPKRFSKRLPVVQQQLT